MLPPEPPPIFIPLTAALHWMEFTQVGSRHYLAEVIDDNGCEATDINVTITVLSTAPPATTAGQPVSPNNYACAGNVYLITTQAIGGTDIHYSWNTGTNSSVVLFSPNIGGPFSPGPFQTTTNQVYAQFGTLIGSSGYNICVQGSKRMRQHQQQMFVNKRSSKRTGHDHPPEQRSSLSRKCEEYSCGISGGATQYNWTIRRLTGSNHHRTGHNKCTGDLPNRIHSGQLCVTGPHCLRRDRP
jgi:hypothetical protein